jgi:thymidine kinase
MTNRVVVFTGPMKTAKTLRLLHAYQAYCANQKRAKVIAFKPHADTRYNDNCIRTRLNPQVCIPAKIVRSSEEILRHVTPTIDLVLIDEANFFDADLHYVVIKLRNQADVFITGLDKDYRGLPFGPMPHLLAIANEVHKLRAYCDVCKREMAEYTQMLEDGEPASAYVDTITPEGSVKNRVYETRCQEHFVPPPDLESWVQMQRSQTVLTV